MDLKHNSCYTTEKGFVFLCYNRSRLFVNAILIDLMAMNGMGDSRLTHKIKFKNFKL